MGAPLSIGILGATGRVGSLLIEGCLADPQLRLGAAITRAGSEAVGQDAAARIGKPACGVAIAELAPDCFNGCDVVVDFSLPEGLDAALDHLSGLPLVTGTTGVSPATLDKLTDYSGRAPVLAAANFSTGLNVLLSLVTQAAKALPSAEIEIVETHHRLKKDSPSGTALALGSAVAEARGTTLDQVARYGRGSNSEPRDPSTIAIHALRMGQVVGEHTVHFGEPGETLRLCHTATHRNTFADGALRAAKWLVHHGPGQYTMAEMLGLTPIE